jgi:hypothetical protein
MTGGGADPAFHPSDILNYFTSYKKWFLFPLFCTKFIDVCSVPAFESGGSRTFVSWIWIWILNVLSRIQRNFILSRFSPEIQDYGSEDQNRTVVQESQICVIKLSDTFRIEAMPITLQKRGGGMVLRNCIVSKPA